MFLGFFIYLVFISVTSGTLTIASFISAIVAWVGLITLIITVFFPLGDEFVKLFPSIMKNKKIKYKKWKY